MAKYTEWALPPSVPGQYPNYLDSIAEPNGNKLFYTKYILGIIGELDTNMGGIREWTCPPSLEIKSQKPNFRRIDWGGSLLWAAASQSPGALFSFDPNDGIYTRWMPARTAGNIAHPNGLDADESTVWFTSYGFGRSQEEAISRFDVASGNLTTWLIPDQVMREAFSIKVDRKNKRVWVCSSDGDYSSTRAWIGFLDLKDHVFVAYYPKPYAHNYPSANQLDVDGDYVWFTASNGSQSVRTPAIYRMDKDGNLLQFTIKSNCFARSIAADGGGGAWATDIQTGLVIYCDPAISCDKPKFERKVHKLNKTEQVLTKRSDKATCVQKMARVTETTLRRSTHQCSTSFRPGLQPDQIRIGRNRRGIEIFFTGLHEKIGRLSF